MTFFKDTSSYFINQKLSRFVYEYLFEWIWFKQNQRPQTTLLINNKQIIRPRHECSCCCDYGKSFLNRIIIWFSVASLWNIPKRTYNNPEIRVGSSSVHNSNEIEKKVMQAWNWNEIFWWRCQAIDILFWNHKYSNNVRSSLINHYQNWKVQKSLL